MRRRIQQGTLIEKNAGFLAQWAEYEAQPDGKQVRRFKSRMLHGTKCECQEQLQQILAGVNAKNKAPSIVPAPRQTLNDAIAEYRRCVLSHLKPRGAETITSHLTAHIMPSLGSCALAELNLFRIQQFVHSLSAGRSAKTVENIILTLSGILRRAHKWGWTSFDFQVSDLDMPKKNKPQVAMLTGKQIRKLIEEAEEPLKTILCVLAGTAMRINECLALSLDDLDFENKEIHIRHSAYNGTLGSPKSKASESSVPLPDELAKQLKAFLAGEHYRKNPMNLLFANRKLRPYSDNKLRELHLRPLLKRLGMYRVSRLGFHAIRHGVASELIHRNTPFTAVRDQLRHSDVRITLQVYGHTISNSQRRAMNDLSKRMLA